MNTFALCCLLIDTRARLLAAGAWPPSIPPDSLDTVHDNLEQKKAVLIDVREPGEWKQGHLAEAQLVPLSEIAASLSKDANLRTKYRRQLCPRTGSSTAIAAAACGSFPLPTFSAKARLRHSPASSRLQRAARGRLPPGRKERRSRPMVFRQLPPAYPDRH